MANRWNPRALAELRAKRNSPSLRRAYQIMFPDLKGDDLKRAREWHLFVRFCEAGGLDVDPAEVDMLDPPFPDLKADVFGRPHFFELGEVVQEDWLRALARHEKATGKRPLGPIESPLPVLTVWSPLEVIIGKKMKKRYDPDSKPLSLVLYSERNSPPWDVLQPLIEERRSEIGVSFDSSEFDHLWLYLAHEGRIPFSLSKKNVFTSPP